MVIVNGLRQRTPVGLFNKNFQAFSFFGDEIWWSEPQIKPRHILLHYHFCQKRKVGKYCLTCIVVNIYVTNLYLFSLVRHYCIQSCTREISCKLIVKVIMDALHLGKSGELRANIQSCFTLYWFSHKTYGSKKQQWSRKKKVTKNKCCSASGTPAVIVKCQKLNLVFCNNKLKFSLINVSRG